MITHYFQLDWNILALPVRLGGLGLGNPSLETRREYASSVKVTKPLVKQIVFQSHQLPESSLTKLAQQELISERSKELEHRAERIKEMTPRRTQRALDLATKKGSSAWLTVLPFQDLDFNLNKREFRDAVKLRYDWPVEDIPCTCACGEAFTVDHSMICKLGGFITQRHSELRDLEAEFLSMVRSDVEIEPVLQDISGEHLNRGSNKAQDARLDIYARGFWERHRSAFFDLWACHPNAVSYGDLEPQLIYRIHENEKKRLYSKRVLHIEHGTFTLLVFTTTGGMGKECLMYHSRLLPSKKGSSMPKPSHGSEPEPHSHS